jgi:hypothetical protein
VIRLQVIDPIPLIVVASAVQGRLKATAQPAPAGQAFSLFYRPIRVYTKGIICYFKEATMTNPNNPPQQIQINTGDEMMRGRYSNSLIASHSPEEFILDWLLNSPSGTFLVSRIMVSPSNLRRIINALEDNLEKYERQFGPIKVIDQGEQKFH